MRKLGTVVAVVVVLLGSGVRAEAITNGVLDGNAHPNVGALILGGRNGINICSGTLIDRDTFLTASHCTVIFNELGLDTAYVTFDPVFERGRATVFPGTPITIPRWAGLRLPSGQGADGRSGDVGVVELFSPIVGITPASLPRAGELSRAKAAGSLHRQTFTVVGYGNTDRTTGGGKPTFGPDGERRTATARYRALNNNWLHLSQNPSVGAGGACYGDSGGPNFLGRSAVIAGITIAGDIPCGATNLVHRLDVADARDFLSAYTVLP